MSRALHYGLQPGLLVFALSIWILWPESELTLPAGILTVLLILGTLETLRPARPDWVVEAGERWGQIFVFVGLSLLGGVIQDLYGRFLEQPLAELRAGSALDIWPHTWPALVQLFMVFFLSEFIWYWIHRAEHRWAPVWRVSGHGAHHAFKKLGALNSGLNHPFELALIVAPGAFIALVFGVGEPAAGAVLLGLTQAAIAHTNLDLNTRGIGWLFTTNRYHIHHHSVVLEESNTNYGCSAIIWDRVFGTFADAATAETGTGPSEPGWWGKLLMPFVEPSDTATAPGAQ